ncbi:MAG TPA: hypothetical protein VF786_10945 [Terriglobales bacterium]
MLVYENMISSAQQGASTAATFAPVSARVLISRLHIISVLVVVLAITGGAGT